MASRQLAQDPYNVIIAGVGGQGNVMASRVLANMLVKRGYYVTIGETFGASQRGGSVMSHLRVSATSSWSPQIPRGRVDVVIALEPTEGIRILKEYGNPQVTILSNTRAIRPVGVIAGEQDYPSMEEIRGSAQELASTARFIDATEEAIKLGNPVLGNVIMLGAFSGLGVLPMDKEDFKEAILKSISQDKLKVNLKAYEIGRRMIEQEEDSIQHQN
jgi:indolepyruvate ferredoxin oxidoreductase beta subunit